MILTYKTGIQVFTPEQRRRYWALYANYFAQSKRTSATFKKYARAKRPETKNRLSAELWTRHLAQTRAWEAWKREHDAAFVRGRKLATA
jgi:hypothetical protein